MQICDLNKCTGCMACMNICPNDAIEECCDEKGFYFPKVKTDLCTECSLCQNICPEKNYKNKRMEYQVFACWSSDSDIREKSTSGGVFSTLADEVLKCGGVVFGAVFESSENIIVHTKAETNDDIAAMRGSKYVESKLGFCYREVKNILQEGRYVLFSGTPCQIKGLRNYLGKEYKTLILVDLVCHGVPSPLVFASYLDYLKRLKEKTDIDSIHFRNKEPTWEYWSIKSCFSDGTYYVNDMYSDLFIRCFQENYCLREACYDCTYAGTQRQGDITLGDFWGYISEKRKYRDDNKGISLVLINTENGEKWFDIIRSKMVCVEKTYEEAAAGNAPLVTPSKKPAEYSEFWNTFLENKQLENSAFVQKPPTYPTIKHKLRLWLDRHYYIMPTPLKGAYKKVKVQTAAQKRDLNEE